MLHGLDVVWLRFVPKTVGFQNSQAEPLVFVASFQHKNSLSVQDRSQGIELEGSSAIDSWETHGKDATSLGLRLLDFKDAQLV